MIPDDESYQSTNKASGQDEQHLPLTFRRLAVQNAEAIGLALVDKAKAGNYNAAHLLFEVGGIGTSGKGRTGAALESTEPRMFLLDLVDRLMSWDEAGEDRNATDKTIKAGR